MGEALINRLPEIITAVAALVAAIAAAYGSINKARVLAALAAQHAKIDTLTSKVDDGAKETQRAIAEIAKAAVNAQTTRAVRATDTKGS